MDSGTQTLNIPIIDALAREPYEPRGILNSEMALILGLAKAYNIDLFIESGRARGQSTYLLAKHLPNAHIDSVERVSSADETYARQRVGHMPNVTLRITDGTVWIPEFLQLHQGRRVALLLDGPKGHAALDLMERCAPYLTLGFIHDMRALDHGEPSPYRKAAEERFPNAIYSDNPELVARLSWLDAPVWAAGEITGWRPYHIRKTASQAPYEFTGSYGPTVGAFFF